jgi:GATA-binding protein
MNLDDFINTENIATPSGTVRTTSQEAPRQAGDRPGHASSSAIPIKSRKESAQHFIPQSVPAPANRQRAQDEFGYVTRHTRKTSIDERRVCDYWLHSPLLAFYECRFFFGIDLLRMLMNANLDTKTSGQLLPSCACRQQYLSGPRSRCRRRSP